VFIKKTFYLLFLFSGILNLASCSLLKANDWNAFSVILEVSDASGAKIEGAKVQSSEKNEEYTDTLGRVVLFYTQTGFHIVTIQYEGMLTKQVKLKLPDDADKIVLISLQSK